MAYKLIQSGKISIHQMKPSNGSETIHRLMDSIPVVCPSEAMKRFTRLWPQNADPVTQIPQAASASASSAIHIS